MGSKTQRAPALYGIVAFKVIRGVLLLSLAMGAFTLVGDDLRALFERALRWVRVDPETDFFNHLGDRIEAITPANVGWVATGTLIYGLLSVGEGLGLAWRVRWVGWLVLAESAFFVPLETFAFLRHPRWSIGLILLLNVAIVAYLYRNRERLFRH